MLIGIDGNEANVKNRVGSNVYSFELISELEKLDKKNEYTIYLSEKKQIDLPKYRDKFGYRQLLPKYLWTQWRLPLDLYLHRPQPQAFFTPGHYAPRWSPTPTVISILDLSFLKFPRSFKPTVLAQLKSWTKHSALSASHILTISRATKKDIINAYKIPSEKITVTYPGVNQRFTNKISDQEITRVKKKHGLNKDYFLFVGTRQPKKNLTKLVQAYQKLNSNADLVIVGKTWRQFSPDQSDNFNQKGIKIIGYVPDQDLPSLIKGAVALILPSLYEGFGIPVAEAMTVGIPVVVSNSSSLPEVAGDSGILVDPTNVSSITNGLKRSLSLTPEKRLQLINKGKVQAQKFSWEKCAKDTLAVLYDVATQR